MIQWWYGHNAVGFFLTAGFLGMMYYFMPKHAERPVYSYRLSIIHFWALIFLYIWAGPHHLHYTALPDWAQTLGMMFSIMLWMPSWGGMINGLMTLSGAWDKLRTDPVLRMLVVSVAFYGMATFEGPLMSIKAVNSLSHYTDWTIGHVHSGALGWVGFVSFGALYCLVPRLWDRKRLYSLKLVNWHFWIATIGIVLYISAMWVSGIMQGLMWRAYDLARLPRILLRRDRRGDASVLHHPRAGRRAVPDRRADHGLQSLDDGARRRSGEVRSRRVAAPAGANEERSNVVLDTASNLRKELDRPGRRHPGRRSRSAASSRSRRCSISRARSRRSRACRPYTPLELAGRNIYVREGCYLCHSQMIRPFRDEVERYGHYSPRRREHVRPSVPVGLQAHRARSRRASAANIPMNGTSTHLTNPRAIVPQSVMPGYAVPGRDRTRLAPSIADSSARQPQRRRALYATSRSPMPPPISKAQADPDNAGVDAFAKRYPKAVPRNFDGKPGRADRDGCAGRLSADARHAGRLQALQRKSKSSLRRQDR